MCVWKRFIASSDTNYHLRWVSCLPASSDHYDACRCRGSGRQAMHARQPISMASASQLARGARTTTQPAANGQVARAEPPLARRTSHGPTRREPERTQLLNGGWAALWVHAINACIVTDCRISKRGSGKARRGILFALSSSDDACESY